ncbi:MAG: hypothetical protein Unbinned2716contig1000_43 [Prokaryotic dsDNA virus sp.]|nr:MAG: hypothetical protein Unbinned2716contig1000_43 [Prokaryotic dsDNA virus sp.]|tara:strand:+ start:8538 stop:8792 length:255 start_codon:yes stop_codon:yes gene_type:complete
MTKIELQTMEILIRELPKIRQAIENLTSEAIHEEIQMTPEELLEDRCERLRENNVSLKLEMIELQKELNELKSNNHGSQLSDLE